MSIALNIIGGIVAGLFAAGIYERIRRPRLDITLLPQSNLTSKNGSWTATRHVRVTNRELLRFLRRFLRRSDAHSCYAWVILPYADASGASFGPATWMPLRQVPSISDSRNDSRALLPSGQTATEFIDIGSGGAADIAIVEKATRESVCYIVPWGARLEIGEYVVKVEVGCSGLPPVVKWFLLQNQGTATNPNSLAESFSLKELKGKEAKKYLSLKGTQ